MTDETAADRTAADQLKDAESGILTRIDRDIVGPMQDFRDPSQEWRRLFSEVYGTFLLVIVAAGGGMMRQAFPNTISRAAAVVAPGLMVLGIIMFMGKVSGAHLNPAVSVAFALRGDFPWPRVPGYVIVQLIGATLAALFLHGVIDVSATFRVELRRQRLSGLAGIPDGGAADDGPCQRHPGHRLRGPRTSASSVRSASAPTSRSPGCGAVRSPAPR